MPRDLPDVGDFRQQIPFSIISPLYSSYVEVTVPGGQQAAGPIVTALGNEELFWITENGRNAPKLYVKQKAVYWQLAPNIPGFLLRSPAYQ
jgi:hypothetical protein